MACRVNPDLAGELARFGAGSVTNCFNCGNCTAVCPLSEGDTPFPRKMVRYAQLGLKEKLVQSPEPWLCYYCGECSATCPRDAQPGETMAALRRYAIAWLDPTGLARLMYRSRLATAVVSLLLAVVLGFFLTSLKASHNVNHWVFRLVPYEVIHTVGIGISVLFGLLAVAAISKMLRQYSQAMGVRGLRWPQLAAIFKEVAREILTMKRHRQCETDAGPQPWYLTPRVVHISIMAGSAGLLLATLFDFVFVYLLGWVAFPNCACCAARLVGTVSGLVMLYGVSVSIYQRSHGQANHLKHSVLADWWLLAFLLVLAITGFWLEVAVLFRRGGPVQDAVVLVHTVMAMELVLLAMLTKLSHAIYRPLALAMYFARRQQKQSEAA